MKFGRLIVRERAQNTAQGRAMWRCVCDCGGEKVVAAAELKKGRTRSCGCLAREQRKAAAQRQCHDAAKSLHPREYSSWQNMLTRCFDPGHRSFHRYGGRGITVCPRWRDSFAAFLSDMGVRPHGMTLDRINPDAGYAAENCRWATRTEQANNRCDNRILEHDGMRMTVAQWSARTGISHTCLTMRLKRGWPVHRVLTQPVPSQR